MPLPSQRFFGILTRKERWGISWRGWLAGLLVVSLGSCIYLLGIYPFFAITQRTDTRLLAVEGWVHDYAIREAVREFKTGSYQQVFTTGGPVEGVGAYVNDYSTAASIGAGRLKAAGIPAELVQMVPSRIRDKDRTYSAAVALRDWFCEHHVVAKSVNVMTADVHARRTRLLFQMAFGRDVEVGIISVPTPDYDARHWWRYSEGVREILGETIAYVYAKVFFFPPDPVASKPPHPAK